MMMDKKTAIVEKAAWMGYEAVKAESDSLIMTVVPKLGSRVVSIYSKAKQIELLRTPQSEEAYSQAPLLYGIPVLFPPNRIEDGRFSYRGQHYQFDINDTATGNHSHGLVHDKEWMVTEMKAGNGQAVIITEFNAVNDHHVMRQFPHPFRLVMKLVLEEGMLTQTVEVHNDSSQAFPWGIGYHTTFHFPFREDSSEANSIFSAPIGQRWELNCRFLPTGIPVTDTRSGPLNEGIAIAGVQLDDLFQKEPEAANEAVLTDKDAGIRVRYMADEAFGHWVLHNGDGTGRYLCPEPYTCVTNAFNLKLSPEITGMKEIEPGRSDSATCVITVEHTE
ncbi:aldose 1-epimerase [Paenibacillus sp. GXUN7292]|uniref:aldose 1-epimerase n=1 Tax=Paenibacillus sp. GXUN7292 TaxID=3422499 RepID=UPI003D7C8621